MGYQSRVKQIRRRNARVEAKYFAQRYGEVPIAEELINTVEVQEENQDNWSSRVLLVPPHFSGKNYEFWAIKMRSFLRAEDLWCLVQNECVHPLDLEAFEALTEDQKIQKHELALRLIQQAVDESIFHKIAVAKTSKEAWRILEEEFSERGSNMCKQPTASQPIEEAAVENPAVEAEDSQAVSESHGVEALVDEYEDGTAIAAVDTPSIEAFECSYETVKDSVSQAELDKFENNEAHCAEPRVDEDGVEEEAVIVAAENGELATQEVAGQPVEAEKEAEAVGRIEEDELMKSMPMREEIYPNGLDVCECAGIESKNQPAIAEEKEHAVNVPRNFDEDLKFIEEWLAKPKHDEDCNFIEEFDKIIESCMEDEAFEFCDDGHCDMPRVLSSTMDKEICFEEAEEEDKPAENIFMKWSVEEIRHYYQLMSWQHANEEDENKMKDVNSMWDLEIPTTHELRMLKSEFKDEDTRQQAIEEFADIDGRIKPKELEENMKKKVRMKKKVKKNAEFKVWSKRKKKKPLHQHATDKNGKIILRFDMN